MANLVHFWRPFWALFMSQEMEPECFLKLIYNSKCPLFKFQKCFSCGTYTAGHVAHGEHWQPESGILARILAMSPSSVNRCLEENDSFRTWVGNFPHTIWLPLESICNMWFWPNRKVKWIGACITLFFVVLDWIDFLRHFHGFVFTLVEH